MNPKRFGSLVLLLALVLVAGGGCSKKARLAALMRQADADFAAEKYEAAEVECRDYLRFGMQPEALARLGLIFSKEGRALTALPCLKKADELNPKNPEVKAALAAAYLSLGSYSEAFPLAKAALALQPNNTQAQTVLSESARFSEEIESARALLRALPGQVDQLPEFHVALATLALKSHDTATAQAELNQALARDPKSAEAHYRLSQMYFQAGDVGRATNELHTSVSLAPWRSPIRVEGAAFTLRSSGAAAGREALNEIISHAPDYIPARVALMRLDFDLKQYDDCKKDIAAILEKDPDNYDAALQRGIVELAQSNIDNAITAFSALEAKRPKSPGVKYYLGRASLSKEDTEAARRYLTEAVDLNTNYTEAILLLAQVDLRSKNIPGTIQRLERLIRQQPSAVEPRLLLAEAYTAHDEPDQAIAIYRQLIEMQPKNPHPAYLLGLALAQTRDLDGARKAFNKALELAPDFQPALDRLVELDVAEKKYDAASQLIQQQISQNPKSGHAWLLQARVWFAQKNYQQAEQSLNKAIALDPGLVPAYVSLAQIYVANHQEQQALDKLNSLIARTNDVSALMAVGVIQEQLKNYQAAADAYEKILSGNPNFVPALNNAAVVYTEKINQLDKALAYAKKANELSPYNPNCADTLGWVFFKRGEFARAVPLLKVGADGEPGELETLYHLGMAYYMTGAEGPARVALQSIAKSVAPFPDKEDAELRLAILSIDPKTADAKAAQILEAAVQRDPRDPVAAIRLAGINERNGQFDAAAELYQNCLKSNSKIPALMARLAALYADHLSRPDDALKVAQDAHDLDGGDPFVCATLGRLSLDRGQVDVALSLLQRAADQDGASPRVFLDLARARYAAGKVADAQLAAQTALARNGGSDPQAQVFSTLVSAAQSPAAAKTALPQARTILQHNPRDLPALMVCAAAAQVDGDFKGAIGYYETALAAFPQFPLALWQSAVLWAGPLGDDDKAFGFAEKAEASFPSDLTLAKILGRGAYKRGDYARSSRILQDASNQAPDGEMLYYLGMDYYKLQRAADSKKTLEKALAMNIPPALATDAKRALAEMQ